MAGKVYAIDESRLWLVGFNYDGLGPGKKMKVVVTLKIFFVISFTYA